ncbi:MAG: MYG1 family protein, partial [Spirochaetota bacterium]|nr:MYG1 family protein [Spirochaetota bacterium]
MSYTIITHNGKAHMDELLGSALLALHLEEIPENIERMDSQEAADIVEEGNIPENTYFVDCGLALDSERGLFDHHQDRDLDSAVLLIFNEFFSHMKGTKLHDYIKLVSKVDTKGAMSLDDFHLVSESRDYFSFGQRILLKTFENDPMLVLKIFIDGLNDKISFEKLKQKADIWLKEPGNIEI